MMRAEMPKHLRLFEAFTSPQTTSISLFPRAKDSNRDAASRIGRVRLFGGT
jgi:hypothetical protein